MEFNSTDFKDFIKPKHRKGYGYVVPRSRLQYHHSKLLEVIQMYFICEGRFSKVHHDCIRILMHFNSKKALNLLYYLVRILCNMDDRVQEKGNHIKESLFHFSLTKLLVIKELEKKEKSW